MGNFDSKKRSGDMGKDGASGSVVPRPSMSPVSSEDGSNVQSSAMECRRISPRINRSIAERTRIYVGVINIGSYSSDCALSFTHNPARLFMPKDSQLTSILFDKEQNFVAYGNEAKCQYDTHCIDRKEMDYFFFQRFNMELFNSFINPTINDIAGKSMSRLKVLSATIEYFRNVLVQASEFNEDCMWFVLVVPEILKETDIAFIRKAARNAQFNEETFLLISEAQAACICCHHLYKDVLKYDKLDVLQTKTDTIVVDTGCEIDTTIIGLIKYHAVDITVNVIRTDNSSEDLMQNRRWKLGRDPVDKHYRDFLDDVFGSDVMDEFKETHSDEYEELFFSFYFQLRTFRESGMYHVNLQMPSELIRLFERRRDVSFEVFIKSNSSFRFRRNILRVLDKNGTILIKEAFKNIIASLKLVLKKSHMTHASTIVLFGWLAESPMFQNVVMESFLDKRIVIPENPKTAVMIGASLFGHDAAPSDVESKLEQRRLKRFSEK